MSLSKAAAQAFADDQDYFEEIVGPVVEKGYLVRTIEEVPEGFEYLKTTVNLKTYTKQYTGVVNIGGYETFYTIIGLRTAEGYQVLTKKEYQEFLDEWKDVESYTREEYAEICRKIKEESNATVFN